MSIKKTLVAAAILAGVSGTAIAENGDTARVDNIRWVYDLTIQKYDGNMIITDVNDKMITVGHEFDLAEVDPKTLAFPYNFAAPAVMVAQTFEDDTTNGGEADDGIYQEGEKLTPVTDSEWVINSGVANVVSGGVITKYETNDLTFRVDTDSGDSQEFTTAPDGTATGTTAAAENTVSVYVKSDNGDAAGAALSDLSSVFVLGSITATDKSL